MIELSFLRHAKSDYEDYNGDDFSRKISDRGTKKTHVLGVFLQDRKITFDHILCSPSRRTLKTLDLVLSYCDKMPFVEILPEIYDGDKKFLIDYIKEDNKSSKSKLIIGHEPTLSSLVDYYASDSENEFYKESQIKFSTSSLFQFKFLVREWSEVEYGKGVIEFYYKPKL